MNAPAADEVPAVLLPYQQDWHADESEVRIAEKARRVGFSWSIAAECVLDAATIGGCDCWYVGYNKDMAEEFIRDAAFWAKSFDVACSDCEESIFLDDDEDKAILTFTIRFASGHRITALSSRPTNLRGKEGHVVIDEAAFHDDLAGLIKAAMAVKIWGRGSRIDVLSTHNGVDSHFNSVVEDVKAEKLPYSLHRVTFTEALKQGLFKRICLANNIEWTQTKEDEWLAKTIAEHGDDADEELGCIPAKSGATYIYRDVIEKQMRDGPIFRLELPPEFKVKPEKERESRVAEWCEGLLPELAKLPKTQPHFFGEDFGRTADISVITPGYLTQKLRRRFPFAVEMRNVPYEQQRQVLFFVVDRLPNFFAGKLDATGNGDYLAEVAIQRYGESRIECVKITDKWYAENLPPFRAGLEDGLVEVVRHADHLSDLRAFKLINGVPKLPKAKTKSSEKGKKRHGDAGIAYVLGYAAAKMPITDYSGYESAATQDDKTRAKFAKFNRRRGLLG